MSIRSTIIILMALVVSTSSVHQAPGFIVCSRIYRTSGSSLSSSQNQPSSSSPGDKLRESTRIRPSLHPTTINTISEIIRRRSVGGESSKLVINDVVKPLDVAIETGKVVSDFLLQRRETSEQDGMAFDVKEEQTIAGRVVGVVMRLDELGSLLHNRVGQVNWVKKYNDWASFGTLQDKSQIEARIATDPLFALCRSECLLALFLNTIEAPKLLEIGETVPDGSRIDFVDADRLEVLLGGFI